MHCFGPRLELSRAAGTRLELLLILVGIGVGRSAGVSPVPRVPWDVFEVLYVALAVILSLQVPLRVFNYVLATFRHF